MKITTGRVRGGRVDLEGQPLPEGAKVLVVATEDNETFEIDLQGEIELDAALAEVSGGEVIEASDLLKQIRSL